MATSSPAISEPLPPWGRSGAATIGTSRCRMWWPSCSRRTAATAQPHNSTRRSTSGKPPRCLLPGCIAEFRKLESDFRHTQLAAPAVCRLPGCIADWQILAARLPSRAPCCDLSHLPTQLCSTRRISERRPPICRLLGCMRRCRSPARLQPSSLLQSGSDSDTAERLQAQYRQEAAYMPVLSCIIRPCCCDIGICGLSLTAGLIDTAVLSLDNRFQRAKQAGVCSICSCAALHHSAAAAMSAAKWMRACRTHMRAPAARDCADDEAL